MYKPKAIPAIRLPKLFELPTDADVTRCMSQAEKMRGRVVELPFLSPPDSALADMTCVLASTWNKEDEAPTWIFYVGDAPTREAKWRHMTRDLGLIASLAQRECLGDTADVSAGDRLSAGKKAATATEEEADLAPSHSAAASAPAEDIPSFNSPMPAFQPMAMGGMGAIANLGAIPGMPAPGIGGMPTMPLQAMPNPAINHEVEAAAGNGEQTIPWPTAPATADQAAGGFNTTAPIPFADPPKTTNRTASMEGELTKVKVPNLLQSLGMGKMTGLLNVAHNDTLVEIWVDDGQPVHATTPDCKGEAAIMELLTWDVGRFQFFPNERSSERTVLKRLDNLLMESSPLIDQYRYLKHTGVSMDSYLIRKHPNLTEAEFEQRIARGARADIQKQKQFYQAVDHQCNLFEILRKMPLAKVDWIPLVYNLVVCDLVTVSALPSEGLKALPIEAMGMDRASIQVPMQGVYRPETGLINYPVILYFLEQEFFRWEHAATPFSIVTFEMCRRTAGSIEQLTLPAVREAIKRISSVKRNVDSFAHFETNAFMLVLPFTKVQAAELVAKRIVEVLRDQTLGGDLDSGNLALAFGVAGIPEDCQDLGLLLSAAKQAINKSKQSGTTVVAFQSTLRA
ncbi:MAG: DUF4388 domain-containing protein [Cyanobacteria bacterium REEB67]|nr:DUF4388 domain-containing protein [Cyanobacteria bacterium REEB67]